MDGADWDERYGQQGQVWSGRPNPALVLEVAGLTPGAALDVGCGEGADAIWLAERGWAVTGLDISTVALERAAMAAGQHRVSVTWAHCSLSVFSPPQRYDLVSALYPALPPDGSAAALLGCVADGGTLLVVGHAHIDPERLTTHGHHLGDFVQVGQIRALLGEGWVIDLDGQRPRIDPPLGAEHTFDEVLRARRVS